MKVLGEWLLLPQRFAIHEPTATAVLADLHLGYAVARQRQGDAIPARSVAEEMQPLVEAARLHKIRAVIVAGDLFERGYDRAIAEQFLDVLTRSGIQFLGLVPGNHDRGLDESTGEIPLFKDWYDLAGWQVINGDKADVSPKKITGHWHPAKFHAGRKRPCFLAKANELILPAFSLDAAGVNISKDKRWLDYRAIIVDRT